MPGNKSSTQLQVAIQGNTAFVRVQGRATFRVSKSMKAFGQTAIERGAVQLVLDMRDCIGMDSTFMGVLAGLALQLRDKDPGKLYLVNCTPHTRGLLATLGLDQLVEPHEQGQPALPVVDELNESQPMTAAPASNDTQHETAMMMLEAHETLVALTPENAPRFRDVVAFLREDVARGSVNQDEAG